MTLSDFERFIKIFRRNESYKLSCVGFKNTQQ